MNTHRPWPLVLMTAVGAWIAAVPLVGIFGLLFGRALESAATCIVLGGIVIAAATAILRREETHSFIEEMAVPVLFAGGALLAMGLHKALPDRAAWGICCVIATGVAILVTRGWLRTILAALAAIAAHLALSSQLAAVLWLATAALLAGPLVRWADDVAPVASGWGVGTLLALAASSGITFLAGAALHGSGGGARVLPFDQGVSLVMGFSAAALLLACWASLRQAWIIVVTAVLMALSYTVPPLGAVLLILATCLLTGRWKLAIAGGIAAAWVIGAYYYQLNMPLHEKAVVLAGAGAMLGGLAWVGALGRQRANPAATAPGRTSLARHGLLVVSMTAVLAAANTGIWLKEALIRTGRPVFIALAPVDPRSLMQGDYMRLNFAVESLDRVHVEEHRVKVVARVDERGIATLHAVHRGQALAANEILVELVNTGSGLRPGTDAWYFKEGEGERWAQAKYGEFRIDSKGRTLLVDLRGDNLRRL